jgi:DNA-binding transcriptional LysR family regulator
MQFARSDLADLTYFLAIARHRSFRRAGLELGVSASALSHALKGLETRLGVRLLNRTNRSVMLTAAGEELQAAISSSFDTIGQAVEALGRFRDVPVGRIRLNVAVEAASLLLGPVLPEFFERYPDVELDIVASNRLVDVTEGGFDAGIRYGGTVPEDMITQRISAEVQWLVVGAPSYLDRFGTPQHPNDLLQHRCIKIRLGDDRIYRWEFEKGGEDLAITVQGPLTIDLAESGLGPVLGGVGLMYLPAPLVGAQIAQGTLRAVLQDWAPMGPGFHIYYSSRRHVPVGLRLLIDLVRELRPLGY